MSILNEVQQKAAVKLIKTITPFTEDQILPEIVTDGPFGHGTIAQALYLKYEQTSSAHISVMSQLGSLRQQLQASEQKHGEAVYQMQLIQIELDNLKKQYGVE
ncbi:hypothetical protein [Enterobacter hormaechei]|uniref:hypothetical protein n=1 Tax=Enterobacter hormaechei TaxID=158836 RepID=UPI003D35A971